MKFQSNLKTCTIKKQIFNEPPKFNTGPRIDARKEDYVRPGGNVAVSQTNFSNYLRLYYKLLTFIKDL